MTPLTAIVRRAREGGQGGSTGHASLAPVCLHLCVCVCVCVREIQKKWNMRESKGRRFRGVSVIIKRENVNTPNWQSLLTNASTLIENRGSWVELHLISIWWHRVDDCLCVLPTTEQELASHPHLHNNNVIQALCDSHIWCLNRGGICWNKTLNHTRCQSQTRGEERKLLCRQMNESQRQVCALATLQNRPMMMAQQEK